MQEWIPIPGTTKGRLVDAALLEFEEKGFEAASVTEIAAKANVTTGSLYHHFGSKLTLYTLIRGDVEKRLTDRMEGAMAMATEGRPAVNAALLVAFDAAVTFNACRLLGGPPLEGMNDPICETLIPHLPGVNLVAARALSAAWRSVLLSVADGDSPASSRQALEFLLAP